ncbi:hypothetical protein [Paenibacillus sp.]|uniref:hypothetical protein n=1 Tax=Paenibacillus sp. TaxID=58172 RepID=UPI002D22F950|nr:hypothetical protein [Paenibacillus sp.]HZG85868.1 hypothetical protein [Paenibacillus sp.]
MRKALTFIAMILAIVSLAACQKTEPAAVSLEGKKLLYVEKASSGGDFLTVSQIKKMGFEVTEIFDGDFTTESAEGFDLVFVSSSISSGKVGSKLYKSPVPVVYAEPQNISDIDLAGWDDTVDNGTVPGQTIAITNPDHPIAAGFSGNVDVYKSEGAIGFAKPGGDAQIVATAADDEQKAVVFAVEKGGKNLNGHPVPARQAFIYLDPDSVVYHTEDGWKLLEAVLTWAVSGK